MDPARKNRSAPSGFHKWVAGAARDNESKRGSDEIETSQSPPDEKEDFATREKSPGMLKIPSPQPQPEIPKMTSAMILPPFPEMRRTRAFDNTRGDIVQLIEVAEGAAKKSTVTEQLVRNYICQDFRGKLSARAAGSRESTKLFYSVQKSTSRRHLTPIPISEKVFDKIAPYARIPPNYIEILCRPIATQVFAHPQTPRTSSLSTSIAGEENLSFIIRSAAKGINGLTFGATFTYHIPTRTMYSFLHIYEEPPYISLLPALTTTLSNPHSTPFIIPLFLLHIDTEQRYKFITSAHSTLFALEKQAGIRESTHGGDTDFSGLSKDLSYFLGNLSLVTWACKTMRRQLKFVEEVGVRYRVQAVGLGVGEAEIEKVERVLREGVERLGCENESIEEQAVCLSERAQALIQTVYSGIAQRDAALSQVAANAAARDSAIMRIITAVTVCFLPATTVATFFSTSFFDFKVSRYEKVYSWWLWLYWVTTILLTVFVMAVTFWWWRKKERELNIGGGAAVGASDRAIRMGWGEKVRRFRGLRRNMIEDMSDCGPSLDGSMR